MGIEQILPALGDTSVTMVVVAMFVWMVTKQPKQISEAMESISKRNEEQIGRLADAVITTAKSMEKIADRHRQDISTLQNGLADLAQQISRLTVVVYTQLSKSPDGIKVLEEYINKDKEKSGDK